MTTERITLTTADKQSALWGKLDSYLSQRIEALRSQNDDPTKDAAATAALRGEIKALKALRAMGDERPTD